MPSVARRARLLTALIGVLAVLTSLQAGAAIVGQGYLGSLTTQPPTDDGSGAEACTTTNWSEADEQQLPGTTAWKPGQTKTQDPLVGYLDRDDVHCGDKIGLHLSGHGAARVFVYRVGWYGGTGARSVWHTERLTVRPQATASLDPATHMVEADWPVTTVMQIPPTWVPGLYLAEVRPVDHQRGPEAGAIMPFVVEGHGTAATLAVASTLTYSAYNSFGSYSTYFGATRPEDRALKSSKDRPLVGGGLVTALVFDLPLARYMTKLGMDVDWTTDEGLDTRPSQAASHQEVVFGGHSEYWTSRMYDAVESARNKGSNLLFFSGDPVYWQTRLEPSPTGAKRRMAIFRFPEKDPDAATTPSAATVRWRDSPLNRDEAELVGLTYARPTLRTGLQVADAPSWLLAGTGLTSGSNLPGAAAHEVDTITATKGATPNDLQVVLRGAFTSTEGLLGEVDSVYYTTPGGGAVFSAGTTVWPGDLEGEPTFGVVPSATGAAIATMTKTLLLGFLSADFAATHPSVPSHLPPLQKFVSSLPSGMLGKAAPRTHGGLSDD